MKIDFLSLCEAVETALLGGDGPQSAQGGADHPRALADSGMCAADRGATGGGQHHAGPLHSGGLSDEPAEENYEIPLLGVVAAGEPIEAVLNYETVCIPRDMLRQGRMFALRVRGDSMIDEQIREDDFIILQSQQTAENGQTVVALIDGSDATVKRFYGGRNQVRLEAANPRYKPIVIRPPERVQIQGVVVGVIRKYKY